MFKRLKVWWILGVLLTSLMVVGVACGDDDGADGEATQPPPTAGVDATATPFAGTILTPEDVLRKDGTATQEVEIEWGWMFELSGPPQIQIFGLVTGDGVRFAVQEINDAGGFQIDDTIYTIKLLEHDTESDPGKTIGITRQLVVDDGVNVIWGPAALGEAEATLITQPEQVLHLCACQDRETTSLSSVEKAAGESHWAFQTLPAVSGFFLQGALNLKEDHPEYERVAIICIDTDIGRSVCGFYEDAYEGAGFEIVGREDFPPGTTDYTPLLTNLKQQNPDVLLNFDDPTAQINILGQALDMDVAISYNTSLPPDIVQAAFGDRLEGKIITAGGIPRQATVPTSAAAAAYFERYAEFSGGELPLASFVSLLSYDFVYMLVAAMQQAGTVEDTTAIADALETIHYAGSAEDDIYFTEQHISVMGSDGCTVEYQKPIVCSHDAPPKD